LPAFFCVLVIFKIGSLELFAQASLEPWSSWSLPPALQAWATGVQLRLQILSPLFLVSDPGKLLRLSSPSVF
jgi:hypothetical protein